MKRHIELQVNQQFMRGYYHKHGKKIVIIVHGIGGNKLGHQFIFEKASNFFALHNISSLRMDFLGTGESDGVFCETTHSSQIKELESIISFARNTLMHEEVYLVGLSIGAYLALMQKEKVNGIIAWNPHFDIKNYATNWKIEDGKINMGALSLNSDFLTNLDKLRKIPIPIGHNILILRGTKDKSDYKFISKFAKENKYILEEIIDGNHLFESETSRKELFEKTIDFVKK